MPWYQPCVASGYSKFYSNPATREDRYIVSDAYLNSLLTAYRQAYVNAGGPDYEDSDDLLLDRLAANCVGGTSDAASLGRSDAERDRAAGQDYHPQSLAPGGVIPETAPIGTPLPEIVYATTNPSGQPTPPPALPTGTGGNLPSNATSGPGGVLGYGTGLSIPSGPFVPTGGAGGSGSIPWLLLAAIGAGAYFLLKKG